ERDVLPGYVWSFPLGERGANVGLFVRRSPTTSGRALAAAWQESIDHPFLRSLLGPHARLDAVPRSWPIPTELGTAALSALDGRVLFVGDAARAADPFTGEGVAQALETGVAAGRAIALGAGEPVRAIAASYERDVRASLLRDNRLA